MNNPEEKKRSKKKSDQFLWKIEAEYLEKQYELLGQIGRGSFAKVLKARQKNGNKQIKAIKRIQINPILDEISEIQSLKVLKNDHIIQFYGYLIESNQLNIIMQLCKGSLRDQLKKNKVFSPEAFINLIVQVTSAMLALNQKSIMHLDLKPENILFEEQNHYRLCDFGCSQLFGSISRNQYKNNSMSPMTFSGVFGTPQYIAPQIQLGGKKIFKNSCDIWSFGVVLYQIIYAKHPFHLEKGGRVSSKDFEDFVKNKIVIEYKDVNPKYPIELIKQMLKVKPQQRIKWREVKARLISEYNVRQAQFLNIQAAANNQERISLIFGYIREIIEQKIVQLIQDQFSNQDSTAFWKDNFQHIVALKQIIVNLGIEYKKQFEKLFESKINRKLSAQKIANLTFMNDYLQIEYQQFKNEDYKAKDMKILQKDLKHNLSILKNSQQSSHNQNNKNNNKNNQNEDKQLNIVMAFIQQSLSEQVSQFFCTPCKFPKTCQLLKINKDEFQ